MRRYLQSLPPAAEFAIVITVAFGPSIVFALWLAFALLAPEHAGHARMTLSQASMIGMVSEEVVILAVLGSFLHIRGWTMKSLGIKVNAVQTLYGLALLLVDVLVFLLLYWTIAAIWPAAARAMQDAPDEPGAVSLAAVLAVCTIDPLFEEMFVCGYVIAALRNAKSPWLAINVSVAIRLLYHLYQGAVAAINIVPSGLIMAIWYTRTAQLWPVIVAHSLWDLVVFLQYVS